MSTKNKPLDGLFAQLQDIKDADGKLMNTVLFSKNGNPCSSMPPMPCSMSPTPTC